LNHDTFNTNFINVKNKPGNVSGKNTKCLSTMWTMLTVRSDPIRLFATNYREFMNINEVSVAFKKSPLANLG